jgi:hypothetical protein
MEMAYLSIPFKWSPMHTSIFSKEWLRPNSYYSFIGILRNWMVIAFIIWVNIHYWSIWLYIPSVWLIGGCSGAITASYTGLKFPTIFIRGQVREAI